MSLALYDDVVANLSWYQLNSGYNDPMYIYMSKIEQELFTKIKLPLLLSNYTVTTQEDFVILKRDASLQYGTYQCSRPIKEAYFDSTISCLLFQFPFYLEKIQFGWIGLCFAISIMLISIFGGIKESYRWFILNQAIWDAFLCYDYICAKPTIFGWSKNYLSETTCFYTKLIKAENGLIILLLASGLPAFIRNASFIPVFHLVFSRFICMYFPKFYKNFTKNGYKIFIALLIFNAICIAIFCISIASTVNFSFSLVKENEEKCGFMCPSKNISDCLINIPEYFQCQNRISLSYQASKNEQKKIFKIFKNISYSIPPMMFLLSILCAGFLFFKISSQLKFQLKTNRESFKQTIKISSVVGFQCITMSMMFVITGIQKYMQIKHEIVGTLNVYKDLPSWLFLLQYYTTTASLNMIRIILDSCIILLVLNGYSRCVAMTFKFIGLCFINPKKTFKKMKSTVKGSNVTIISAFPKR